MSEHAIAGRAFSSVCEVCRNGSDVSGVSWGVLWYSCGPRLEKRTHDAAVQCTFAFVMHDFAFGNHNQTSAHGAGRCEVGELPGLELPSSVLGGLNRYITHLLFYSRHIASTHPSPARSHTSGTGIHPMEKPQCRREKPRPSYSPQSGGLDETHLQLHQDRIKLQGKHDFFVARHASSSTITSDCEFDTCNNLMRTR